ncbi:hypothetical protein KKF84_04335 [Myxococcota bacterium]|nr:hypothetical protein [Myxococcota bacterium]
MIMLAENLGVKVFTATKAKERDALGNQITNWLREANGIELISKQTTQSSDNEYHCLTVTIVYKKS